MLSLDDYDYEGAILRDDTVIDSYSHFKITQLDREILWLNRNLFVYMPRPESAMDIALLYMYHLFDLTL